MYLSMSEFISILLLFEVFPINLFYFLISWEVAGAMQQLRIHRLNDVYDVMMSFNF